jgi:hypothetical protein
MALQDFVTVSITAQDSGVTRAGFGTPLFLSNRATWAERTRIYKSAAEVKLDFPGDGLPENLAAQAFFGQSPKSKQMKIGRCDNKPTMVYSLSAVNSTANATATHSVRVRFGIVNQVVSFVSDATPTDAEYAAGMVAALNAVVGKNYTASGAASPVLVTGNTPNAFFSVEVLNRTLQKIELTHVDPGIAADLDAINSEDSDWYALDAAQMSAAMITAAAAWIEANKKLYVAQTSDSTVVTELLAAGNDVIDDLNTLNYSRSSNFVQFHPSPWDFLASAIYGKCLRFNPGEETWALKSLSGITTVKMTSTERSRLTSKSGNSYELVKGRPVTFNGGKAGSWIDQIRGLDWFTDDMQSAVFGKLASVPKVAYTNQDLVLIENEINASCERAFTRRIIDEGYTVFIPRVEDQSVVDRSARYFPGITFTARLQGAVHSIDIVGTVTP